ncbi:MAG: phytoene/squalene synthase family protein, partial [Planctomycetota bacterium]
GGVGVSGAQGQELAEALRHCRDVTRRRARNFYYGLKLTPEPQRSALYSIYAWMRRADDLVDGAADEAGARRPALDAFRAATDAALAGSRTGDDPLWVALSDTASRYDVPREAFHGVLEGQLEDLTGRRYETFGQLRRYCERVASTVGLICISIWGYRDPAARELAVERGIAFQLTNILRDYRQDYDAGRVYLPQEDFDRHRLTPALLRKWDEPARCRDLVLEQVARAQGFYDHSAPLEGMITPSCRPTLWAMTTIYHGLLKKLEHAPQRMVSDQRLRLSSMRKGIVALQARRQKPVTQTT